MRVQAIITWFVLLGIGQILLMLWVWSLQRKYAALYYEIQVLRFIFRANRIEVDPTKYPGYNAFGPDYHFVGEHEGKSFYERSRSTIIPDPQRGSKDRSGPSTLNGS